MQTFQSILADIEEHTQSLEWKTDQGDSFYGVLIRRRNQVTLNINPKTLAKSIDFEYIYHDGLFGNRRVLYPYDISSDKHIPKTGGEIHPLAVFMIVDKPIAQIPRLKGTVSFTYKSFIWDRIPEKAREESRLGKLVAGIQDIQTNGGKVSVSLSISQSRSIHPSVHERRMDEILITIEPTTTLSNKDILKWNARFSQLLTLLNQERVPVTAISRDGDNITVPTLIDSYEEASYAFRKHINIREFTQIIRIVLPSFIDNYDAIASFTDDLTQYYYDYPLIPPDSVQLLRLFTSLEQCAIYAQKIEKILKRGLTAEQTKRQKEFDKLLKYIDMPRAVSESVRTYLRNDTQKFYVSSGSLASPKNKIKALAQLLAKKYKVYNCLSNMSDVEVILKMRNVVAHGFYDQQATDSFYAQRNEYGQAIEECVRMYLLRVLGCTPKLLLRHKDPLKARLFNI